MYCQSKSYCFSMFSTLKNLFLILTKILTIIKEPLVLSLCYAPKHVVWLCVKLVMWNWVKLQLYRWIFLIMMKVRTNLTVYCYSFTYIIEHTNIYFLKVLKKFKSLTFSKFDSKLQRRAFLNTIKVLWCFFIFGFFFNLDKKKLLT